MNRKNNINCMKKSGLLWVVLVTALYGCGEDPVAPSTNNDKPDMQDMDVSQPDVGGGDMPVDQPADMCIAQTMCPTDSCGMIGDGCGGQLDCGACQCENGQPVKVECGQCGVGNLNCGGAAPACEEVGWPAFGKVECKNIVYVRAGAPANAAGSKEAPLGDINEALRKAQGLGKGSIVLIGGNETFNLTSSLELSDEIHLVGGIDPVTWTRSPNRPELIFTLSGADAVAVRARNVRNPTLISGLRVRVGNNPTPGGNVYGLIAEGSNGLVLERLAFEVGAGGNGVSGQPGSDGSPGGAGQDGLKGSFDNGNGSTSGPAGGRGGVNLACEPVGCEKTITVAGMPPACELGGRGGRGGGRSGTAMYTAAQPGAMSVDGLPGGLAGTQTPNQRGGGDGRDGANNLQPAEDGVAGRAVGRIDGGVFVHDGAGIAGQAGARGRSGSGGGGATHCDNAASVPISDRCQYDGNGPSGAGGGAGGCGGSGGQGGLPGGSSFGLLAIGSQGIIVRESTFQAGVGGSGGAGSLGGNGGAGGSGGRGTSAMLTLAVAAPGELPAPYSSGNGGTGVQGQPGGAGGGGGGGFSYGAWCEEGTQLTVEGQVNLLGAGGGVGGAGRIPALDGATGLSGEHFNCLP